MAMAALTAVPPRAIVLSNRAAKVSMMAVVATKRSPPVPSRHKGEQRSKEVAFAVVLATAESSSPARMS